MEVIPDANGCGRGARDVAEPATAGCPIAEAAQESGGSPGAPIDDELVSTGSQRKRAANPRGEQIRPG